MPRDASLFETCNGSIMQAFLLLRSDGKNIPPAWIDRSRKSRRNRQPQLGKLLKSKSLDAVTQIQDWELAYKKECFYLGLRVLFELERTGKTKL